MFRNYLLVAFRNLTQNKVYSLINILGFALGLTICILISLYVYNDLSFDRFHTKADNIYRMYTIDSAQGVSSSHVGITMPALPPALLETVPEVEASCRIRGFGEERFTLDENSIQTEALILAEQSFFDIFDFTLISGDKQTCLTEPNALLLSPQMAKTLFGDEDPIGKSVTHPRFENIVVTGIIEPSPENSHIRFDAVMSIDDSAEFFSPWGSLQITAYLLLAEGTDPNFVVEQAIKLKEENGTPEFWTPQLQPFMDVHLHSSHIIYDSNYSEGDYSQVRALSVIALFVLLIASINFMNLSTARSAKRAREVGLRKVIGAQRFQMVLQFLGESVFLTTISTAIAIILAKLALPSMNNLSGRNLEFLPFSNPEVLFLLLGVAVLVGIISGIYPAEILSRFKPAVVLKGNFKSSKSGILMRRFLVIGQFSITIALLIGTLVVVSQIYFVLNRDPGYDRDQVVILEHRSRNVEVRNTLLDRLDTLPSILAYGTSSTLPVRGHPRTGVNPEGSDPDNPWIMSINTISPGYLDALGMEVVEGRAFSPDFPSDSTTAVMLNEAAVSQIGWDSAVGKKILSGDPEQPDQEVIGVIGNYNFASVRETIEPMIYSMDTRPSYIISVKLEGGNIQNAIRDIEKLWVEIDPETPFQYSFLDDEFSDIYTGDHNFATVVGIFSSLAIIIACLGLFGLASYSTEQRRKEIAVRKVLGAGEGVIVRMLTIDFIKWVAIANVIAWPVGYFAMTKWLDGFVYKIDLTIWPFLIAGLTAAFIAILTVISQSLRASRTNPSLALRVDI